MEHSKEFYIQHFLRINDFEHVELKTIKTIIRLYKILKQKDGYASNNQLLKAFSNFIENIDHNNNEEDIAQHLQPPTSTLSYENPIYQRPQQQYTHS